MFESIPVFFYDMTYGFMIYIIVFVNFIEKKGPNVA